MLDTVNPSQDSWAKQCDTLQCANVALDFLLGWSGRELSPALTLQMGRMCTACEW